MSDDDAPDFDRDAKLDDLREAVEDIPHGDPETVSLFDSGTGHFIIEEEVRGNEETFGDGFEKIDDPLAEAGFEPTGILDPPEITQQNVKIADETEEE